MFVDTPVPWVVQPGLMRMSFAAKVCLGMRGFHWVDDRTSVLVEDLSSADDCQRRVQGSLPFFWSGLAGRLYLPIALKRVVSTLVFAPTGAGKGVSVILPFLFRCRDSVVVLDFKGENARLSGEFRKRMGQKVVYLDPYQVASSNSDSLNPLDFIDKNSLT